MSTDTVAVDREALAQLATEWVFSVYRRCPAGINREDIPAHVEELTSLALARGILRDAEAVRHEHCGRIARWAAKKAQQSRDRANFTDRMSQHKRDEAVGEARAYAACARLLRGDTEPPPP